MPSTLTTAASSSPKHFLRFLATRLPPWAKNIRSLSERRKPLSLIYRTLHICTLVHQRHTLILLLRFFCQRPQKPLCHMINRVKICIRLLQAGLIRWNLLLAALRLLLSLHTPCPISMLALHLQVPSHALSQDGSIVYIRPFQQLQRQHQYTVERNPSVQCLDKGRVTLQHGNNQSRFCPTLMVHFRQ